ncbi:cell surface protein [Enterococcus casseliflavus]|uniref:WxL domain-containing protein n=1 Tax=Enterococcus casseliflavus TaxID=37734 RepID=UPI0008F1A356|nr:WxL domain-containing protein [Enterococcus casseliflavus]GEB28752.1 cell surface protein [Enterococcus casseliflavus]SFD45496.1 WxL domain surface cell wall-binding [Enterococcus casseliflavus]STP33511.1 cell surface protein [Enterococcus casseliflavus]
MKLLQVAAITLVTTTLFAGGQMVLAEQVTETTTDGFIQFEPNEEEELIVTPPIDEPDVEIKPEVPGTTGPLSIVKVPTMNFGKQVISNQDKYYEMIAEKQSLRNPDDNGPKEVPYVSFAQVQDLRGTNDGWNLKVRLTDFTSDTHNGILTGAHIILVESNVIYEGQNSLNKPDKHENELELKPGTGAVSVMKADVNKGAGTSSIVWGKQDELTTKFVKNQENEIEEDVVTNSAIQLYVPGKSEKDATMYKSTLTWELAATPEDDI